MRAAADLAISDRSKTFGLVLNETGMIHYYYLAFKLFGYHVRSIFALYIGILAIMAFCFIGSFRRRAIFILPSIFYLLLLLIYKIGLPAGNYNFPPLTNSRMLPFLSLYPVLYCLTLAGAARHLRFNDAGSGGDRRPGVCLRDQRADLCLLASRPADRARCPDRGRAAMALAIAAAPRAWLACPFTPCWCSR